MFPKRLALITAVCASGALLAACGGEGAEDESTTTSATASETAQTTETTEATPDHVERLTAVVPELDGVPEFAEKVADSEAVREAADNVEIDTWDDEAETESLLADGEHDIVIAPVQKAARAFHEGANIRLAGATFWEPLVVAGVAETPEDPDDATQWTGKLAGKKIATALPEDSVPALALRHILDRNELQDTEILHVADTAVAQAAVDEGEAAAMLTYATTDTDLNRLFKLQDEWARTTGSLPRLPSLGVIVDADFAEEHRDMVRTVVRAASDEAGEDRELLPGREVASELGRFYENIGQTAEDVIGARTIDPDFFLKRRA